MNNDSNTKPSKPRRKPSLSWFKIKRYSWTKSLLESDPVLLYQEFRLRADAYADPELREKMLPVIQQGNGRLTTCASTASTSNVATPVSSPEVDAELLSGNSHPFLFATPAIAALTCRDVSILTQQAAPNAIPLANEHSKPGRAKEQVGGPFSGHQQVAYIRDKLSIDSHRYSRHPSAGDAEYTLHCKIDLDFTDAVILESLKHALPVWRKSLNEITGHKQISQEKSEKELAKIVDYNLIPILDLMLWEKQNSEALSPIVVVRLLGPGREQSDDTFRKTWKKNLKKFLTPEGHQRLYAAAYTLQLKQQKD